MTSSKSTPQAAEDLHTLVRGVLEEFVGHIIAQLVGKLSPGTSRRRRCELHRRLRTLASAKRHPTRMNFEFQGECSVPVRANYMHEDSGFQARPKFDLCCS